MGNFGKLRSTNQIFSHINQEQNQELFTAQELNLQHKSSYIHVC